MFADAIQRNDPTVVNPVVDERSERGRPSPSTVIPPRRRHKRDYWLQRNARQMQLRFLPVDASETVLSFLPMDTSGDFRQRIQKL